MGQTFYDKFRSLSSSKKDWASLGIFYSSITGALKIRGSSNGCGDVAMQFFGLFDWMERNRRIFNDRFLPLEIVREKLNS